MNISEKLFNFATKLGNQKHLKAISDGMMLVLPLIVIGALFMIVANPPIASDAVKGTNCFIDFLVNWKSFAKANYGYLTAPFDFTMGFFGVLVSFSVSYSLAKTYKLQELTVGLVSMSIFFLVCASPIMEGNISNSFLGASGLFVAFIISFATTEIFRFCYIKKITFKITDDVPQMVINFVNSLVPIFLAITLIYGTNILFVILFNNNFPNVIMDVLTPGLNAIDNIWIYIGIALFAQILWLIGINGTSLIFPLVFSVGIANTGLNGEAVLNGNNPEIVMNLQMFRYLILGGAGNTLGLVFLMLFSKNKQLKVLGRVSLLPGICGINEPVIFGLPIVFNPILAIPFMIMPSLSVGLGYLVQSIGIVKPGYIVDPSFTPFFVQAYLSALDFKNIIFALFLVFLSAVVYYPFFKIIEKKMIKESLKEI